MSTATKPTSTVEPIESPFKVAIEQRENLFYQYLGLRADACDNYAPLIVRTEFVHLKTGDYTIIGLEDEIAIERKSFEDLFGTLGNGRERFVRELERLDQMKFSAVVVEASWKDIAYHQPLHSRMSSKSVVRSILAFTMRYRVQWFMAGNRAMGEAITYRLLERFWKDKQEAKSDVA